MRYNLEIMGRSLILTEKDLLELCDRNSFFFTKDSRRFIMDFSADFDYYGMNAEDLKEIPEFKDFKIISSLKALSEIKNEENFLIDGEHAIVCRAFLIDEDSDEFSLYNEDWLDFESRKWIAIRD